MRCAEFGGDVDVAEQRGYVGSTTLEAIAQIEGRAMRLEQTCATIQAVQRAGVQRSHATLILAVGVSAAFEQHAGQSQQMFSVASRARLCARAEQNQQYILTGDIACIQACAGAQQHIEQSVHLRAVATIERILRDRMQRGRALLIGRIRIGTRFEQCLGGTHLAERGGDRQRGTAAGHARISCDTVIEQGTHHGFALGADRGCEAVNSGAGHMCGVGTRFEQANDQRGVPATGGPDQRGRAVCIFTLERKPEGNQAIDRIEVTDCSGAREVGGTHAPQWQPPCSHNSPLPTIRISPS